MLIPQLPLGRLGPEVGHLEDAMDRQEGQRYLKAKLVIRKGTEQTTGRLKKPDALTGVSCRVEMFWHRS